jgi:molybdate transport system substrate-binding protein
MATTDRFAILAVLFVSSQAAPADEVPVAVAANFAAPVQAIAAHFERGTGHRVAVSLGSTGKLSAQIRNGAPYEALLAADSDTPSRLQAQHVAVAASRFTYVQAPLSRFAAEGSGVRAAGGGSGVSDER